MTDTSEAGLLAAEINEVCATLRNPGPNTRQYADFYERVALLIERLAATVSAGAERKPAAWIAFAGNGNVRFWTDDPQRARAEKSRGMDLREFSIDELISFAAAGRKDAFAVPPTAQAASTEAATAEAWQWRYVGENEWRTPLGGRKLTEDDLAHEDPIEQRPLYAAASTEAARARLQCLRCGTVDAFGPVSKEKK